MKLLTDRERGILDEAIATADVSSQENNVIVHSIGRLYFLYNHLAKEIKGCNPYSKMPSGRMECVFCGIGSNGEYRELGKFDHSTTCVWVRLKEGRE